MRIDRGREIEWGSGTEEVSKRERERERVSRPSRNVKLSRQGRVNRTVGHPGPIAFHGRSRLLLGQVSSIQFFAVNPPVCEIFHSKSEDKTKKYLLSTRRVFDYNFALTESSSSHRSPTWLPSLQVGQKHVRYFWLRRCSCR